jgi:hypothetical protein
VDEFQNNIKTCGNVDADADVDGEGDDDYDDA